jgi:hypothetical protein
MSVPSRRARRLPAERQKFSSGSRRSCAGARCGTPGGRRIRLSVIIHHASFGREQHIPSRRRLRRPQTAGHDRGASTEGAIGRVRLRQPHKRAQRRQTYYDRSLMHRCQCERIASQPPPKTNAGFSTNPAYEVEGNAVHITKNQVWFTGVDSHITA